MAKMTVSTSSRRLLPVPRGFCVAVGFHEDVVLDLHLGQFTVLIADHLNGRSKEFEAETRIRDFGQCFRRASKIVAFAACGS